MNMEQPIEHFYKVISGGRSGKGFEHEKRLSYMWSVFYVQKIKFDSPSLNCPIKFSSEGALSHIFWHSNKQDKEHKNLSK